MQQRDPLVECEPPEQVVGALVDRQRRVTERKTVCGGQELQTHEQTLRQAGGGLLKRFDAATALADCQ